MPVSTLRCTGSGSSAAPVHDGLRQRVDPALGVDDRRQPVRDDRGRGLGRGLGQHEDRRVDAGLAQRHALLDERDPEPGRAGIERGARDRHGAVAVAVGLDHREEFGGIGEPCERDDVFAHRAQVDLDPRGAEPLAHVVVARYRTMSPRATMPTTVSPCTTGTWVTSCSCISVATSSTVASGPTCLKSAPSRRRRSTTRPSSAPRRSVRIGPRQRELDAGEDRDRRGEVQAGLGDQQVLVAEQPDDLAVRRRPAPRRSPSRPGGRRRPGARCRATA